jgi:hypothetical protein
LDREALHPDEIAEAASHRAGRVNKFLIEFGKRGGIIIICHR